MAKTSADTDADAGEPGGWESDAVNPRFLRRFDRWAHPARRFRRKAPVAARGASEILRFAAGILSRLESPAVLHRTRSILGGPLVRPLAEQILDDLLEGLKPPAPPVLPAAA